MLETETLQLGNTKSSRCNFEGCTKKIGLVPMVCRCEKAFCAKHRIPETHDCKYDYKTNGRRKIDEENKCIEFAKILKI